MKIQLSELAKALEQSDVQQSYVDIGKGTVVFVDTDGSEDDQQVLDRVFDIEDDFENYVPIPDLYDGEERETMRSFAEAQKESAKKERLLEALRQPGGATRFRHAVKEMLLLADWEAYLHQHFLDLARWFCEENKLEYED